MKKALRVGIVSLVCIAIMVGYYYYLSHRNGGGNNYDPTNASEVEKVMSRDFKKNYPSTPREVVKWYNRIITCFYGEEYDEKQLDAMADQVRMLLDDELLADNPKTLYMTSLKAEIEDYKNRDKAILQSDVCDSNDVTYAKVNGDSCAYVTTYYFSREGSSYSKTYQEYVLRKDQEGEWKILTFRLTKGEMDE